MKSIIAYIFFFFSSGTLIAQCLANAGLDIHRCSPDSAVQLGGNPVASNGSPPYTYEWWIDPIPFIPPSIPYLYASDVLDDTSSATPNLIYNGVGDSLAFFLRITDDLGCQSLDTIILTTTHFGVHLTYHEYWINQGDSVYLDQIPNISNGWGATSYSWNPTHGLSDSTLPFGFWAKPDTSINYTTTVTDSKGCQQTAGGPLYYIYVSTAGLSNESVNSFGINIYPNPFNDIVFIEPNENLKVEKIRLLNLNGEVVFMKQEPMNQINLKNISAGLYYLEIQLSNNTSIQRKIIKH